MSFTIGWEVEIDVEWFQVSYRIVGSSEWMSSPMLSGSQLLFVFQGLTNDTLYEYKVRMRRQEDQSEAESPVQQVATCSPSFGGQNCSIGKLTPNLPCAVSMIIVGSLLIVCLLLLLSLPLLPILLLGFFVVTRMNYFVVLINLCNMSGSVFLKSAD